MKTNGAPNFKKSQSLLKRAKAVIPSASQTYSKSFRYFVEGAAPAFLVKGKGAKVWDADGNEYIDFVLGLGAITIGYNHPVINAAISQQMKSGISFSQPHPLEVELAEELTKLIPCAEMVRFLKNGSDATTAAVRLARAFTGREMVVCCGYHGFHDWYVGTTINNRGVPRAVAELTKTFEFNNLDSLKKLFSEFPNQIAAVILEPASLIEPLDDFLKKLIKLTHEQGALVIFDETVTGFRHSLGGTQFLFGATPDLATFGKGIANGMPLAVLAGRRDILKLLDEGVFVSLTAGGETLSMAAALATIKLMRQKQAIKHVWDLSEQWKYAARKQIARKALGSFIQVKGILGHNGFVFSDYLGIPASDWQSLYQQEMIAQGILTHGINNYCLSHTRRDIERYIKAINKAMKVLEQAAEKKDVASFLKGGKIRPIFKRN